MSEKRFINFYEDGKIVGVADDNDIWLCENGSIVDLLNEQQAIISQLNEMNKQLREINKKLGDDLYNCRLNKKKHNK